MGSFISGNWWTNFSLVGVNWSTTTQNWNERWLKIQLKLLQSTSWRVSNNLLVFYAPCFYNFLPDTGKSLNLSTQNTQTLVIPKVLTRIFYSALSLRVRSTLCEMTEEQIFWGNNQGNKSSNGPLKSSERISEINIFSLGMRCSVQISQSLGFFLQSFVLCIKLLKNDQTAPSCTDTVQKL